MKINIIIKILISNIIYWFHFKQLDDWTNRHIKQKLYMCYYHQIQDYGRLTD